MKVKLSDDIALVALIREKLKANDGYCPCVLNSKGKEEYKCMCKDFKENVEIGEYCHCGLFLKEE